MLFDKSAKFIKSFLEHPNALSLSYVECLRCTGGPRVYILSFNSRNYYMNRAKFKKQIVLRIRKKVPREVKWVIRGEQQNRETIDNCCTTLCPGTWASLAGPSGNHDYWREAGYRTLSEALSLALHEASKLAHKRNQLQKRRAGKSPVGLTKSGPDSGAGAPQSVWRWPAAHYNIKIHTPG